MSGRRAKQQHDAKANTNAKPVTRGGGWLVVILVLALVTIVRLRVADVPIERDEGEYAYAGQLILQGIPPYQLVYNMKFPGTYYVYAAILALFGQTPWGIHVGLLLVNVATAILLFLIARRLLGDLGGAVSTTAFALLSLDRWTMGIFAHATHFVLLPMLAALLMLLRALDTRRLRDFALAGLLAGTAVLMKQQGVFFVPFLFVYALWALGRGPAPRAIAVARPAAAILGGLALPFAAICLLFAAQGVIGRFWFWTFQYARAYVSEVPLSDAWLMFSTMWSVVTHANLALWVVGLAGLPALWLVRWPTDVRIFVTGLFVASLLALSPGFYFREHYFILVIPAVALLTGVLVASIASITSTARTSRFGRLAAIAVFAIPAVFYINNESAYLWSLTPTELSRSVHGTNPFVEAPEIARYLAEHTAPDDRVAVLGSEPELYFYANRKSATGYIYTYSLMESQPYASRMQDEMIQEVQATHPKFVVIVMVGTSWAARPTSNQRIFTWMNEYTTKCYGLVGIADMLPTGTVFRWDSAALSYTPQSNFRILTFRQRDLAPCSATP